LLYLSASSYAAGSEQMKTHKQEIEEISTDRPSIRLLLIEDNHTDALALEKLIKEVDHSQFELTHVHSLTAAMDSLARIEFDLILLDISLPDAQGLETLASLHLHTPQIPIVVLTGIDNEELATEALRQGAQDYLVKGNMSSWLITRSVRYAIERNRALEALRESQERYALAARATSDGLWDWNLHSNEIYYSPRWCLMLGYTEEEIGNSPSEWLSRIHPDDLEETRQAIDRHLRGETAHFESEYRIRHKNGSYRWVLSRGLALRKSANAPYRIAGSQSDITLRKETEAQLIHDALHDPLTRLPNRLLFQQRLQDALENYQKKQSEPFAVLFLDLDRFKTINDSLGHLFGDKVLSAIAKRLEQCIRRDDTIARLGGDEFAVLVQPITSSADTIHVARRMLQAMERPFLIDGHEIFTTGSIGIALGDSNYLSTEEILRDADIAMYRAKAAGTGQYRLFNAAMHARAMALWRLETDLRRAVDREEFRIHYQPIISFKTGRLAGFEALVRWEHPTRGLLYPADFLALAEETGLLGTIDRWTIRHGARQLKAWQEEYPQQQPLFLNANLSGSLLNQLDLPDYIEEVLIETGIDPSTLKLEITESAVLDDVTGTIQSLKALQQLNVHLCIDDFGTGYSSLSSLNNYPINTLKIDSSFVANLTIESGNIDIVSAIITLAHNLDLDVIAEGIETRHQFEQLQLLKCQFGQGLLFSHAVDSTRSSSLLAENRSWTTIA
jgi:diguanylate cyclase (GGDEF)-like protein/PAS domain S-box-containing protein